MKPLPGYEPLASVLGRALEQAQSGKGVERHANGLPFLDQPIMVEQRQQKGTGFTVGQARKKSLESMGLEAEPAVRELLGAINYLAAAVLYLEEGEGELFSKDGFEVSERLYPELRKDDTYSVGEARKKYPELFDGSSRRPFPAG